jgi:hypothetical protein
LPLTSLEQRDKTNVERLVGRRVVYQKSLWFIKSWLGSLMHAHAIPSQLPFPRSRGARRLSVFHETLFLCFFLSLKKKQPLQDSNVRVIHEPLRQNMITSPA